MTTDAPITDLHVDRSELSNTRVSTRPQPELEDGQVIFELERFGFSANNITYANFGDDMGYWKFFPVDDVWGSVPVWGHAIIRESRCDGVEAGQRYFGYFPLSTHFIAQPVKVTSAGFIDGVPHRRELPPVYQRYVRVADAESADTAAEDQDALWRPLFMTSFGAADFITDNKAFGASTVAITSASSKTAMGIAFCLARLDAGVDIVGVTSPRNADFCAELGYYDRIVTYDELEKLGGESLVVIDLAGDDAILNSIDEIAGERLLRKVALGSTHWQDSERSLTDLPPNTELFFLPAWMVKRRDDWGVVTFVNRSNEAWEEFAPTTDRWMTIEEHVGADAIDSVYQSVLEGKNRPDVGFVLQF